MRPLLIATSSVIFGLSLLGWAKKPDVDQGVLNQLKQAGSDLSKPHLYFPTQTAATSAGGKIGESGFKIEIARAAKGPEWLCKATKGMIPELKALQKIRKDFTAIAVAYGGEYDGWGTAIVKK